MWLEAGVAGLGTLARAAARNGLVLACLLIGLGGAAPLEGLPDLLSAYDALAAETDPVTAGQRGDLAAASRWPDDTPEATARRHAVLLALQQRLARLPQDGSLNATLLARRITLDLDGDAFDEQRIPFVSDEGFFSLPAYAAEGTVLRTPDQARAWLARLRALPAFYATETANMRRGLATGFTQPRRIAARAAAATRAAAALPAENNPLAVPTAALPAAFPGRDEVTAEACAIIRDQVKPAERALAAFMADEYVPHARETLGAASLPDGAAYYRYRVRRETTTALGPDEIFAIGTAEIARIRAAMQAQIETAGFHDGFAAFQDFLRHDRQFVAASPEALLERASRLAKMVDDKLPAFFGRLPRLPYGVRPVPALNADGYTTARYDPGSREQGIAGGLMINTSHLDQRPLYELPALVAHEGAPGHHIQIALAQELPDVPEFRRNADITAFVEGWALYAEQLGTEIGLYRTPYERFGLLSLDMWRACRLVIDVGLHWKNYTRDQALACLRDNTGLAEHNIQTEIDRYISWPGQALGYKIGEIAILDLRHEAEKSLGPAFDLRHFHDQILGQGALPLDILQSRTRTWIKNGGKQGMVLSSPASGRGRG